MRNLMDDVRIERTNVRKFEEANDIGYEKGMDEAREAHRTLIEEIREEGQDYINLFRMAMNEANRGNAFIDIEDNVWEKDVKGMVEIFRMYGIEYFTMSSEWSSAVKIAWLLTENGCKLDGMVEINGLKNLDGVAEKKPAFLFKIV